MIELQSLAQYGVYAFIPLLIGVIVYLNSQRNQLQKRYDDLLEKRGDEHKEALLALSAPIERLANFSEFATKAEKRGR